MLLEEGRQRERFKTRYNKKLLQLQETFQAYAQLTGKPLQTTTFSKQVQALVKHKYVQTIVR